MRALVKAYGRVMPPCAGFSLRVPRWGAALFTQPQKDAALRLLLRSIALTTDRDASVFATYDNTPCARTAGGAARCVFLVQ